MSNQCTVYVKLIKFKKEKKNKTKQKSICVWMGALVLGCDIKTIYFCGSQ